MKKLLLLFVAQCACAATVVPISVRPGNHMPLVSVSLDGKSATLILDTGASHTTFDMEFVTNSFPGATLVDPLMVGTSNVETPPKFMPAKRLAVGGRDIQVDGVMALDLSHLDRSVGCNIDGILGMDVLRPTRFVLSLARSELVFVDKPSEVRQGFVRIPSRLDSSGCYELLATLPDGSTRPMLLDSGSSFTFLSGTNSWPLASASSTLSSSDVNGRAPMDFLQGALAPLALGQTNVVLAPLMVDAPINRLGSDFLLIADLLHVPGHIFIR